MIKLTITDNGETIWLNADYIVSVLTAAGGGAIVETSTKVIHFVTQSPDAIIAELQWRLAKYADL